MGKALKKVGIAIAVVALVATGVGAFAGAAFAASAAGGIVASIATYAGIAAGVTGIVSSLAFKPKFSGGGNPQQFQTNPQSGLPYNVGRTRHSGLRIAAETGRSPGWDKQDILSYAVMLSAGGETEGIETFRAENVTYTFDGSGNAIGSHAGWMSQKISLGLPGASALALSLNGSAFPVWTSAHKLTGITHALWQLRFDTEGKKYSAGVPEPQWIGKWTKSYDPRKDSTYPGGSGTHRALNEATYEWTRNGALIALTWALGRYQNGKRTLGIGAPFANIRVADFVEAANIADINKWHCGGTVYSTDSKWNVLKSMLQAAGAVPTMTGAMIGCRVFTPRISIATIESRHLLDELSIASTKSRRERINTVIPRYRSESHEWEVISGSPVSNAAYIAADGGPRTKEISFPLVQHEIGQTDVNGNRQAGQLAAYEVVNSREAGPISSTVGIEFLGLKTGDCVTLNIPEEGLSNQPVILSEVNLDPATGKISFAAETETAAKHPFALGETTTPPPAFTFDPLDLIPAAPDDSIWSAAAGTLADGQAAIIITGANEFSGTDAILVRVKEANASNWPAASIISATGGTILHVIGPVESTTDYDVEIAYRSSVTDSEWADLGTVTTGNSVIITQQQDIADAATTANWSGVADDDGKQPADNATVGSNLLFNPHLFDGGGGYDLGANTTIITGASGDPAQNFFRFEPGANYTDFPSNVNAARAIPVVGGSRFYLPIWLRGDVVNSNSCRLAVEIFFDRADGSNIISPNSYIKIPSAADTWEQVNLVEQAPDDAVSARIRAYGIVNGAAIYLEAAFPYAGTVSPDADFTEANPKVIGVDSGASRGENLIKNADHAEGEQFWQISGPEVAFVAETATIRPHLVYTEPNPGTAGPNVTVVANELTSGTSEHYVKSAPNGTNFLSFSFATNGVRRIDFMARAYKADGTAGAITTLGFKIVDTAGAEQREHYEYMLPTGYSRAKIYAVIYGDADGTYTKTFDWRASEFEEGPTKGARLGLNVLNAAGDNSLGDDDLITIYGVAGQLYGAGPFAYASSIGDGNAAEGAKFAGIEALADVTVLLENLPPSQTFNHDYDGTAKTGEFPRYFQVKLIAGDDSDVTSSSTLSAMFTGGSGSLTMNDGGTKGKLKVESIGSDGEITVTATYAGKTRNAKMATVRAQDNPPSGGGSGSGGGNGTAADSTIASSNATGFGVKGGPIFATCGSAGKFTVVYSGSYKLGIGESGGTVVTATMRIGLRVKGSTGSYAYGSQITGSAATITAQGPPEEPEPPISISGTINISQPVTGLTDAEDYEAVLEIKNSSAKTLTHIGTFSLTAL